jgi:hypothetical protein
MYIGNIFEKGSIWFPLPSKSQLQKDQIVTITGDKNWIIHRVPIAVNEMSASNLSQWSIFYHAI